MIRQHIRYINGHKFITKTEIKAEKKDKNEREHIWFNENGHIKKNCMIQKYIYNSNPKYL